MQSVGERERERERDRKREKENLVLMCEYLRAATSLQEDTKRWEEDGKDDLDNVAASERHLDELVCCVRVCVCSLCDNERCWK